MPKYTMTFISDKSTAERFMLDAFNHLADGVFTEVYFSSEPTGSELDRKAEAPLAPRVSRGSEPLSKPKKNPSNTRSSKSGPHILLDYLKSSDAPVPRMECATILENAGFQRSYIASALDSLYQKGLARHDKDTRTIVLTEHGRSFSWEPQQ